MGSGVCVSAAWVRSVFPEDPNAWGALPSCCASPPMARVSAVLGAVRRRGAGAVGDVPGAGALRGAAAAQHHPALQHAPLHHLGGGLLGRGELGMQGMGGNRPSNPSRGLLGGLVALGVPLHGTGMGPLGLTGLPCSHSARLPAAGASSGARSSASTPGRGWPRRTAASAATSPGPRAPRSATRRAARAPSQVSSTPRPFCLSWKLNVLSLVCLRSPHSSSSTWGGTVWVPQPSLRSRHREGQRAHCA